MERPSITVKNYTGTFEGENDKEAPAGVTGKHHEEKL
jgi:hypothetical protein